ncbi:hypothetical protein BH23CHL2_BH23CHL2_25280 [soil metagenome]
MPDLSRFRNWRNDEGQVLVLFALFAFVLVGVMALALDVGFLLSERRNAQSAADAAALAGGVAYLKGESAGDARAAAIDYAALNGVSITGENAGTVNVDVTGSRRDGRVEVNLTVPVQRFFVGAIYTGDWSVGAHAVAEIHDDRIVDYGLITLQPPGTKFNGDNSIQIINGGAMTNAAVNANPSNSHMFVVDGSIDSAGAIHNPNSGWSAPSGMHTNVVPIDDPLAGVLPPPEPLVEPPVPNCNSDCTWLPGLYKNGSITIKGTAKFAPGIYYFENFDISFQNTNSRIEGTSVLLYFDENSTFDPKNGEMYITAAPTSLYPGGQDGMVFWYANCGTIESKGNTEYYFEGIVYAPCANLIFSGTPTTPVSNGQMIVGSVEMKGTGNIDIQYSGYVVTTIFEIFLVE